MSDVVSEVIYRMSLLEQRLEALETRDVGNPIAVYKTSAGQTIENNSEEVVNFDTAVYDPYSLVTTGASWVYTAPVGGYYYVSTLITFATSTAWALNELLTIRAFVNGTGGLYLAATRNNNSAAQTYLVSIRGSGIVFANADDTIALGLLQATGGSLALSNNANLNHISIHRIGAG